VSVGVYVVRTGTANLASVLAALERVGAACALTDDPEVVRHAERVVLPGVGAFAAAIDALRDRGLDAALRERIEAGRATLGICLGLQLFFEASDESPGAVGLGLLPGTVRRFSGAGGVRIPQLGWNRVEPDSGCALLTAGYAYFANSYRVDAVPEGWRAAYTPHGERFVAAFERGRVLACQFHPELSGAWGHDLLRRWLSAGDCGC
jgi:imidazole glycerol phosphate synthase glutamine amidotransferase subunit